MEYFKGVKNEQEAKLRFRTLAKELHPDKNRDKDTHKEFIAMQSEFKMVMQRFNAPELNDDAISMMIRILLKKDKLSPLVMFGVFSLMALKVITDKQDKNGHIKR